LQRGQLIVFEGSEGAGKSTQLRRLAQRLASAGVENSVLREPGGTPLGDAIRRLVLEADHDILPATEALLFMASRAELVEREIDPLLARGVVVLMDRFFLSTYAYQIAGRGLPAEQIRSANALAAAGMVPSLTLLIDVPAGEGLTRATARSAQDRIERSGDDFHARVGRAFSAFAEPEWQRLHPECGPIVRIDGLGDENIVHARVLDALAQNLPLSFGMLDQNTAT